jgi:hypothetical protein
VSASRPTNVIPDRYRGVAVSHVEVDLDQASLSAYFSGREAYRKTRFVVVENSSGTALLRVLRPESDELFSRLSGVELMCPPAETARVVDPTIDTAVPSALARAAREQAPDARAVIVHGRYEHVSFILDPAPLRIVVREVVPPWPPKLFDQAQRVLDLAETLPPIELVLDAVDLHDLAANAPAERYLLPCRGSGGSIDGAEVAYLDEHPERRDWTLLGCERSRQIHHWFYGEDPPQVSICPLDRPTLGAPTLTKCCLQDDHLVQSDGAGTWVSVPWGSSLGRVSEALALLAAELEPAWSAG